MSKEIDKFRDPASERTLLATVVRHGKDALLDSQAYLSANDFSLPINRAVFTCLEQLAEEPGFETFDSQSIITKAKGLGLDSYFKSKQELEYLDLLNEGASSVGNIPYFAASIKKQSVVRDLYRRYSDAQSYLNNLRGEEKLSDIVKNAESAVLNYLNSNEEVNGLTDLCGDVVDEMIYKIENEEVDQIGLPTGYAKYDKAIGGGYRRGTVHIIAARPKVSKSFLAMNVALNMAKRGIPVLYFDTEMVKKAQQNRIVSIASGCPLELYETGKFKRNKDLVDRVLKAGSELQTIPLQYQTIAGIGHSEALAIARRWLTKTVGFNEKGEANDCCIIYDYIKLTSSDQIAKNLAEWAAIGFMLTDMSNFAIRYKLPILGFVQLNRDGIDNDDGSIISQSDRILWLCSSMSVLRNKTDQDEELNCGFEYGNKKLAVMETRYGAGFPYDYDYVNLQCSLRPRVSEKDATGLIKEGLLYSELQGK